MPCESRRIEAPVRARGARNGGRRTPAIIGEREKAGVSRCRRKELLLAYALGDLTRKTAGNTAIFAHARDSHGAFTQTLRALRIAHGFEGCGRQFRAGGCG